MKAAPKPPSIRDAPDNSEGLGAEPWAAQSSRRATDDYVSLDWLAQRWLCSHKTARKKVRAIGLGIRPAGTWLVSKAKVHAYEASLVNQTQGASNVSSIRDQRSEHVLAINENLKKFGVIQNADLKRRLLSPASSKSRKVG